MPTPVRITATPEMDFYAALRCVRDGKKITRPEWVNRDCIFLYAGFLHLRKADGSLHRLIVSDGDLDATDWQIVREV